MYTYFRVNTSKARTLQKINFSARKIALILQIGSSALFIIISLRPVALDFSRKWNPQPAKDPSESTARPQPTPEVKRNPEKPDETVAIQKTPATPGSYDNSKVQTLPREKARNTWAPNNQSQRRDNFPPPQVNPPWSAAVVTVPQGSRLCLLRGTPFLEKIIDGTISYIPKTSEPIRVDTVLRKCPAASNSMNISSLGG